MGYHVLIAIPAYNEEESLRPLLAKLVRLHDDIGPNLSVLFVDDGSSDRTPQILRDFGAKHDYLTVVTHPQNRGLGAAVQTILDYAQTRLCDNDVLVTMDGDNTHDPAIVRPLVAKLKRDDLDFAVASRFVPGGQEIGLAWQRKLFSRGASLFFRLFFPIPNVRDYSCGYRAYNLGFLRRATARWGRLVTGTGFECMAEIAAKFSRLRPRAGEYPIVLRYDLKGGASKMKVVKTIRGYFTLLGKAR